MNETRTLGNSDDLRPAAGPDLRTKPILRIDSRERLEVFAADTKIYAAKTESCNLESNPPSEAWLVQRRKEEDRRHEERLLIQLHIDGNRLVSSGYLGVELGEGNDRQSLLVSLQALGFSQEDISETNWTTFVSLVFSRLREFLVDLDHAPMKIVKRSQDDGDPMIDEISVDEVDRSVQSRQTTVGALARRILEGIDAQAFPPTIRNLQEYVAARDGITAIEPEHGGLATVKHGGILETNCTVTLGNGDEQNWNLAINTRAEGGPTIRITMNGRNLKVMPLEAIGLTLEDENDFTPLLVELRTILNANLPEAADADTLMGAEQAKDTFRLDDE